MADFYIQGQSLEEYRALTLDQDLQKRFWSIKKECRSLSTSLYLK